MKMASNLVARIRSSETVYHLKRRLNARRHDPVQPFHRRTGSIFVHIPKCAGMSVLQNIYGETRQFGHAPAVQYYAADRAFFDRAFVFTVMREPISRFRSAFQFLSTGGINDEDAAWAREHLTWADCEEAITAIEGQGLWPEIQRWKHFRPQCHYLAGPYNDRAYHIDFIGRQDRMQETLDRVCDTLRLPRAEAQEVNRSTARDNSQLSTSARAILERVYADDLRLWQTTLENWNGS